MRLNHSAAADNKLRVHLTPRAYNAKLGPMPVSTTTATTCPDACGLKNRGCYAQSGPIAYGWRNVTNGYSHINNDNWEAFCIKIAALPEGTVWRHNQAGDLPGINNTLDRKSLRKLVNANRGKHGFTFTHKPLNSIADRRAILQSNTEGFTINLSADTMAQADSLIALNIAPIVIVLAEKHGVKHDLRTPDGHAIVTCPATYRKDVTCLSCQLCRRANRKVIVGFPAHGTSAKIVANIARTK